MADAAFARLVDELVEGGPTLEPGRLSERLRPLVANDDETSQSVVTALLSLALLAESLDSTISDVAEGVAGSADLSMESTDRDKLSSRLTTLLGIPSLVTTAKGLRLLAADDRTFHDVRIVTDARPIFAGDVSQGPVATLIVHSLIVEYHERSEAIKQVTYSLDSTDVEKLKKALERANDKAKALEAIFGKTGLKVLKLETGSS